MSDDSARVAHRAREVLSLANARLGDEYYYNSLSLCAIDAVFSIGVRYQGVQAVVCRYCKRFGLARVRPDQAALPEKGAQESVSAFCHRFDGFGAERMAVEVFANRQRTSSRSGILKAEAVRQFASVLRSHGLEYLQDIGSGLPSSELERDICSIRGQGSGISLQYFWMLAGSDDLIKPDRMIVRFLEQTLTRSVKTSEAQSILQRAAAILKGTYPLLTPRLLDFKIWEFQRAAV